MFRENFRTGRNTFNALRISECILCCICTGLAIYILLRIHSLNVVIKAILILSATSYFFLTYIDIVLTTLLQPFLWTSWIMLSIMASLLFVLCTGLTIALQRHLGKLYIITLIANCVTAITFLIDVFIIIAWLISAVTVGSSFCEKIPSSTILSSVITTPKTPEETECRHSDKSTQFPGDDKDELDLSRDKCIQCVNKKTKLVPKESPTKKFPTIDVPSHGGTFHMSRDIAPILSPSPVRSVICRSEKYYTRSRSPSVLSERQSNFERGIRGTLSENSAKVKSRTVAISVRTVRKLNEQPCSMTPKHVETYNRDYYCMRNRPSPEEPSADYEYSQPCHELQENECTAEQSKPCYEPSQGDIFPPHVHHYACTCSDCGENPSHIAADKATTPIKYSHFTCCRFSTLPTVQENKSYDVEEKPTKDSTLHVFGQSPVTTYNSNLQSVSPASSPSSSTCTCATAKQVSSSRSTNSDATFPFFTCPFKYQTEKPNLQQSNQASCRQVLDTLPEYGFDSKQSHSSAYKCKTQKSNEELDLEPSGMKDAAPIQNIPCAGFDFEPTSKSEGVQTPEIKHESRSSSCDTLIKKSSQNDKQENQLICACGTAKNNSKIGAIKFEKKTVNTELITVLPGAVESGNNNISTAERYVVLGDDLENIPCIITFPATPEGRCDARSKSGLPKNSGGPRKTSKCKIM